MLAISGLLGGAVVLLRPWRLLPLGALLMSAARAVPLSQLLSAWLHQGGPAGSEHEQKQDFKRDQKRDQKVLCSHRTAHLENVGKCFCLCERYLPI